MKNEKSRPQTWTAQCDFDFMRQLFCAFRHFWFIGSHDGICYHWSRVHLNDVSCRMATTANHNTLWVFVMWHFTRQSSKVECGFHRKWKYNVHRIFNLKCIKCFVRRKKLLFFSAARGIQRAFVTFVGQFRFLPFSSVLIPGCTTLSLFH